MYVNKHLAGIWGYERGQLDRRFVQVSKGSVVMFLSSNLIYTTLTVACPLAIQHQSHSHAGLHLGSMHTSLSSDRLLVLLSIIYVAVVILIFLWQF